MAPRPARGKLANCERNARRLIPAMKHCLWLWIVLLVSPSRAEFPPVGDLPWRAAVRGWKYDFPRDHRAHRDFKTEWWYLTGNLKDQSQNSFGYELTFFRQGVLPPGKYAEIVKGEGKVSRFIQPDFKFAHFTVTDVSGRRFYFAQKVSRGAFGEAGFADGVESPLVWLENWSLECQQNGVWRIKASATSPDISVDLQVTPLKPPVLHGTDGISQKANGIGNASHYYSFSRLETVGDIAVSKSGPKRHVRGESWFDHEWSSNQLADEQIGWNWFCIQFDDNTELMLYAMRRRDGTVDAHSSGTWIDASRQTIHLAQKDFELLPGKTWNSDKTPAKYPVEWKIRVPSLQLEINVQTPVANQELVLPGISYWEGVITAVGKRNGSALQGKGYMELTGYANPLEGLRGSR